MGVTHQEYVDEPSQITDWMLALADVQARVAESARKKAERRRELDQQMQR